MKKELVFYLTIIILFLIGIFFDKEIALFFANNRIGFLTSIMQFISNTYFLACVFVIVGSLFLFDKKNKKYLIPFLISILASFLLEYSLKLLFMRERPIGGIYNPESYSFPSGHSAVVFSPIAVLNKAFSKLAKYWFVFAILIAFSRIYLGVHYLTDVCFGVFIGYSAGKLVLWGFKKKSKSR